MGGRVADGLAWVIAGAALWIASEAHAIEPQYRRVTLVDGRVISAEILSTEPQGLKMRVPAGETLIPFELLLDMVPISQSEYDGQADWVVYFSAPPGVEEDIVGLLGTLDGLALQPVGTSDHGITPTMVMQARNCDHDIGCIVEAVSGASWVWVLTANPAQGGWKIQAKLSTSPDVPNEFSYDGKNRGELWEGLHEVLGLRPPSSPPPRGGSNHHDQSSSSAVFDERKVVGLSFIPVPGLPSLAQKDSGGFALAMGVVVPSTVVWVGAVGQISPSGPEFGALSFAGYYAVTVFANQVAGMRSLEKRRLSVSTLPTEKGGAQVLVGGGF